jgi:NADPH2:quinone reductase
MHAHRVVELTGPSGLRWVEVSEPDSTDRLVVEVMAAGVSFADLLYTHGRYQVRPTPPFAPGMDAAGVVRSAPAGSGFEAGQRVAVLAPYGCWQEVITADPSWTLPLPDDTDFEAGAAAPLNYLTCLFALVRRGRAQRGEVLLVHGAAGGVGAAAVQVGRALGLTTMAELWSQYVDMRKTGALADPPIQVWPFADARQALQAVEDRRSLGKYVLSRRT